MKKQQIGARAGVCLLAVLWGAAAYPQAPGTKSAGRTPTGDERGESQLAQAKRNALALRQFLKKMPKGGDLHYHLSGGTYAETMLRDATDDGLCVDVPKLTLTACREGQEGKQAVSLRKALEDPRLYDELIDAFSMRSFVPSAGASGHDHFFDTFARFRALGTVHYAEWADQAAQRAALQNEQYLEVMENPDFSHAREIAREIGWKEDLKALRDELLARNLRENVRTAVEQVQSVDRKRRESEHCGQPDALPACAVDTRFIYQILRGLPKEIVFAQMVLAFEAASADPERIVGINLVMPEDGTVAMADYSLHMGMLKYLHEVYPAVHITLHAGELAFGLVPPSGLCCHVRLAVEAGAERIGHATDVMYEDRPHELLNEMRAKHVMVETCLTSGEQILGVTGERHPFPLIRQFQVPAALSTDDEGVSRIDLTHEYQRAVETYDLSYAALKKMVRTSLEHAFLPGASLWRERDEFTARAPACAKDIAGTDKASAGCREFLRTSEKARQQWELERRFRVFESEF